MENKVRENKVIAFDAGCGEIDVFYLEDGAPVWGARYWETLSPATAAWDFESILRGMNPTEAGWEYGEFDDLAEVKEAYAELCKAVEARNGRGSVIAEDDDTYPEDAGVSGEMFLEALEIAKDVAMRRDIKVPRVGKPKYVLVSSSAGEGPCDPLECSIVETVFFFDRKSAVRAMVAEVLTMLGDELSECYEEHDYAAEVEKDTFKISGLCDGDYCKEYEITQNGAWYRFEGSTEEPETYAKSWRIVKIPDLV